jgi:hypothetical protein
MPTAASENTVETVQQDVQRALKRAHSVRALETKAELVNNTYPLLLQLCAAVEERFQRHEAALEELLEETTESGVEPELADEIKKVFILGAQLGELVVGLIPTLDDMRKKRAADAVACYVAESNRVIDLLDEATLVPVDDAEANAALGPEDDGDDDEEGDDDDDDGGDDDGGEPTPVPAPVAAAPTEKEGA